MSRSSPRLTVSGIVTGFEAAVPTQPTLAGVHLRVFPVLAAGSIAPHPLYEITTLSDDRWGPVTVIPNMEDKFN